MNKATEELKEIEYKIKELDVPNDKSPANYYDKGKLIGKEQGILLGIEETKKEYQNRNCTKHGLICIYCDKCRKELLEKLKGKIIIIRAKTDTSLILIQKGNKLDFAEVKVVKWQDIDEMLK